MAHNIHKGTKLSNVNETWNQNERERGMAPERINTDETAPTGNDLEQVIKEEAAEYDNASSEERLLSGNRATINDDNLEED